MKKLTKKQIEHKREVWRIRKMVQRLVNLQNSDCRICGSVEKLERHHIDGDIRNNSLENITILCGKCHDEVTVMLGTRIYNGLKKSKIHNVRKGDK